MASDRFVWWVAEVSGWRVWFAFEARPGVTRTSTINLSDHCGLFAYSSASNDRPDCGMPRWGQA